MENFTGENLLITISDVNSFRPISTNIGTDRTTPYLWEAQQIDLQPAMGDNLYIDFMEKYQLASPQDDMYQAYQDLLNGKNWAWGSLTQNYPGLKKIIACFAYIRILKNMPVNVTSFGVVNKSNPDSVGMAIKDIQMKADEAHSVGVAYLDKMRMYLNWNRATYTKWLMFDATSNRTSGAKISSADKLSRPCSTCFDDDGHRIVISRNN